MDELDREHRIVGRVVNVLIGLCVGGLTYGFTTWMLYGMSGW